MRAIFIVCLPIFFLLASIIVAPILLAADAVREPHNGQYFFPTGILRVGAKQLLGRRTDDGKWQVCRICRFVWQEPLLVSSGSDEPRIAIRKNDVANSEPTENRGVFVVIQAAPTLFSTKQEVIIDEKILAAIDKSDELLIDARKLKEPLYSILSHPVEERKAGN